MIVKAVLQSDSIGLPELKFLTLFASIFDEILFMSFMQKIEVYCRSYISMICLIPETQNDKKTIDSKFEISIKYQLNEIHSEINTNIVQNNSLAGMINTKATMKATNKTKRE